MEMCGKVKDFVRNEGKAYNMELFLKLVYMLTFY
jgi:hypothetical protein